MPILDLFDNNLHRTNINQFEKELSELKSITENYQALLETLKESESKYRFLTENSADIVWHLNSDFNFTYISPADEKIRGFKQEEVVGKKLWDVLNPEGKNFVAKIISALEKDFIETGKTIRFEVQVMCKDGSLVWTEMHVNPILDSEKKITGYTGVTRDISERKEFEEAIHEKNRELSELNNTKDKFFSIIAHDLRSPFQGLLGVSNILASEAESLSTQQIKQFAVLLNESLINQFKLLEDLLSWARIQSGKMRFEPVLLNVKEELENVVQTFQSNFINKQIDLHVNIGKDIVAFADKDMFWLLMRNLISNAIKFTNAEGKIVISANEDVDDILMEIIDTGVGIEEENIKKLFKPIVHFTTEGTNKESGTGLGLILCKEIIDRHKCRIWVESQVGKGTKFIFTLPKINHN